VTCGAAARSAGVATPVLAGLYGLRMSEAYVKQKLKNRENIFLARNTEPHLMKTKCGYLIPTGKFANEEISCCISCLIMLDPEFATCRSIKTQIG